MHSSFKITTGVGLALAASLALVCFAVYALGRMVEGVENEESDACAEEEAQREGEGPVNGGPRAPA